MDNPNITMEEYIRLEEEKARRRGKVYNWETAKYGKIWYSYFVFFNSYYEYTDADIVDFEMRLGKIYRRDVHRVQVFYYGGLTDLMAEGLSDRMLMEHRDAQGQDMDPMLRLCHMLIACSIAGRSQVTEKVTVTDLFYLRGMDVGSVNVPYLLAMYLRLFASGRKQGAMISGGQFICEELDDTWAWVAPRPGRQPDVTAGTPEDAPAVDEAAPTDPAPMQAPQPPHVAPGTMPQRIARLEEEVHKLRQSIVGLRGDVDRLITD
ncbi:hypothetical protein Tco_0885971 [Tanacetum coccineum]